MPHTYLVTGANRGIGLEFVRQLRARGECIVATARNPDAATELRAIGKGSGLRVLELDVASAESVAMFGRELGPEPIDVLINNAGVASTGKFIGDLDMQELERVFRTNAFGPLLVARALLANLRAGRLRTVVNITSRLASLVENTGGSSYAYRASKAALNQLTRSLAAELKPEGFTCVALNPGWVRTDMGRAAATLSPEESVGASLALIDRLRVEDSGWFFNYDGTEAPW